MGKRRRVVLFGNSIIVATVGASLTFSRRYDVISLSPAEPDQLETAEPDVVVFDLEAARPEAAFSLLETLPGLVLVGISPDRNVVKMWYGKQLRELSTKELMAAIDEQSATDDIAVGTTLDQPEGGGRVDRQEEAR